ncbi:MULTISPECIES: MFS transporter [Acidianus]|nr:MULTISPECIES: MFS transporter [Acidianus]NON62260.1 MFS transporter [Acidianus sp. RZ1]
MISPLLFNMAYGPLSTLISIEILNLGGNSLDIGYAITAGNIMLIPASIFWGLMADKHDIRKITISGFLISSIMIFSMFLIRSIAGLIGIFSAFSFFSTAYNTPMNLLVMETMEKKNWASGFSRLSMLSSIGTLLGLIISTFAVLLIKIYELYIPLGIISLLSLVSAYVYIPKNLIGIERNSIIHQKESFLTRIKMHPLFFLHLPNLAHFKMFRLSRLKTKPINFLPMLYLAIFLFYVSSGLFNTLYPASLYVYGLDKTTVLGIITLGMTAQIVTFHFIGRYIENRDEKEVSFRSLLLRGISYISMGISFLLGGSMILFFGLVFYPIAAGIAFSAYYSASNVIVFKAIGGRRQGTSLGVYSSLVGIAMFSGSLASGYIATYFGFTTDYSLAGIILFISAYIFKQLEEG